MKCQTCFKDVESLYTAYLTDRSKVTDVCKDCREKIEQEDLDKVTYDIMTKLHDLVNGGNTNTVGESLFRSMQRQHRYLQNEVFLTLWVLFKKYGSMDPNHFDARNAGAVAMAQRWDQATFGS